MAQWRLNNMIDLFMSLFALQLKFAHALAIYREQKNMSIFFVLKNTVIGTKNRFNLTEKPWELKSSLCKHNPNNNKKKKKKKTNKKNKTFT